MLYLNQLEYEHIPYPTRVKQAEPRNSTVRSSGCGLCSACMVVDGLTTEVLTIEECVRIAMECAANHSAGTDMKVLAPVIAERYDLAYTQTNDVNEAVAALQRGAKIVAHVGIPEGKEIGLFTKGGHYILLIATDGEKFCILDPSYKEGKFDIPERAGRVDERRAPFLYCDIHVLDSETKPNRVKYHILARKQG